MSGEPSQSHKTFPRFCSARYHQALRLPKNPLGPCNSPGRCHSERSEESRAVQQWEILRFSHSQFPALSECVDR